MRLENIFELLKKYNVRITISRCEPPFDNNLIIEVWNQDSTYFKIKKLFDISELKNIVPNWEQFVMSEIEEMCIYVCKKGGQ